MDHRLFLMSFHNFCRCQRFVENKRLKMILLYFLLLINSHLSALPHLQQSAWQLIQEICKLESISIGMPFPTTRIRLRRVNVLTFMIRRANPSANAAIKYMISSSFNFPELSVSKIYQYSNN